EIFLGSGAHRKGSDGILSQYGEIMDPARRKILHFGAGAAFGALSRAAWAQSYPARPIRLGIPVPPGGGFDSTRRPWAEKGKPHRGAIVIENVGGAGSSVGTAAVARGQPDGYTLLLGGFGGLVVNPIASSHLPYDPLNDFEPIALLGRHPSFIDVHPSQPFR